MRTLTLLRHAKSGWDEPGARDFDRALNAKGRRAAVVVGRHLRGLGAAFDHVVASPAARVMQTLDALGEGLGRRLEPEWNRSLYLASADEMIAVVRTLPDGHASVLIAGHNPGLEELVLKLVPADAGPLRAAVEAKYPTASVAELELPERWQDAGPGCARLVRFTRPRDLDPTLGPDEM